MVIQQTQALFTRKPRILDEIGVLAPVENLRPVKIEKTIVLPKMDYINFITDMTVERLFLRKHSSLCKVDDKGIWHSLLVVLQGSKAGILVMADQEGFPVYAARLWRKTDAPLLSSV